MDAVFDANNNHHHKDKYSLRPRRHEPPPPAPPPPPPPAAAARKPRAAPLSKYRRKTANARERNRMREINQAFETLRRVIPHVQVPQQVQGANEKLTKITTLRLAMKYIAALSATLSHPDLLSDCSSELDSFLLESDGVQSDFSSDRSLLASPDFPEPSLSPVDFGDPSLPALLHTDFTEHAIVAPDDLSEFLLT